MQHLSPRTFRALCKHYLGHPPSAVRSVAEGTSHAPFKRAGLSVFCGVTICRPGPKAKIKITQVIPVNERLGVGVSSGIQITA